MQLKGSVLVILMAIVAISLVISISLVMPSSSIKGSTIITVGRIMFEIPDRIPVNTVDSQTLGKYPGLLGAINAADKQVEDYKKICNKIPCKILSVLPKVGKTPSFQIPDNVSDLLINDINLKFHTANTPDPSVKLYITFIKFGNETYGLILSTNGS